MYLFIFQVSGRIPDALLLHKSRRQHHCVHQEGSDARE